MGLAEGRTPQQDATGYIPAMQSALLKWYRDNHRALPWREQITPYRVWLSEIMLQQTRVETVLPYYQRFLERWPDLRSLAGADLSEVLTEWSGLGYYSRARNLHRTAQIATEWGGFPAEVAALRKLPGIGRYTAGAIASIAFDRDEALVDGNVERVLSRILGLEEDPRSTGGVKQLWEEAGRLLVPGQAAEWNQSLMELGALVCTPRSPHCSSCPVSTHCLALERGLVEELPRRARRKAPRKVRGACVAIDLGSRVWMGRRPYTGLLGGLWELPSISLEGDEAEQALPTWLSQSLGLEVESLYLLGQLRHVFTHRDLRLEVYSAKASGRPKGGGYSEFDAVDSRDLERLALSTLAKKSLDLAGYWPRSLRISRSAPAQSVTAAESRPSIVTIT
jgi:A/G-specific adenine glycosylase